MSTSTAPRGQDHRFMRQPSCARVIAIAGATVFEQPHYSGIKKLLVSATRLLTKQRGSPDTRPVQTPAACTVGKVGIKGYLGRTGFSGRFLPLAVGRIFLRIRGRSAPGSF